MIGTSEGATRVADLLLPAGGMQAWTQIMQGNVPVPGEISVWSPVVSAWSRFSDGVQVGGGVAKSDAPAEYNLKFMWVFDPSGNQYPGWPIDVSDDEDFLNASYTFSLGTGNTYLLNVVQSLGERAPS